jgi:hypothetical protein
MDLLLVDPQVWELASPDDAVLLLRRGGNPAMRLLEIHARREVMTGPIRKPHPFMSR